MKILVAAMQIIGWLKAMSNQYTSEILNDKSFYELGILYYIFFKISRKSLVYSYNSCIFGFIN